MTPPSKLRRAVAGLVVGGAVATGVFAGGTAGADTGVFAGGTAGADTGVSASDP